jgi:GNAT superfamily N-acetyltransferase
VNGPQNGRPDAQPNTAIRLRWGGDLPADDVVALYRSVNWSSATKPNALTAALQGAHSTVSAWDNDRLVGIGYAISDGHLVVNYAHLVVAPSHQRRGIGTFIMRALMSRYEGFHQQTILADQHSIPFYASLGFVRAGHTEPLWIYQGTEH